MSFRLSLVLAASLAGVASGSFACTAQTAAGGDSAEPQSPAAPAIAQRMAELDKDVYRVPVTDLPTLGGDSALVTAVVFTDYACPFCNRLDAVLAGLRAQYGDELRIAIALRPLPMHAEARPAALAALAAAAQGGFPAMHERLVALEGKIDETTLAKAAADIGLDMARFDADRTSAALQQKLAQTEAMATRFAVEGTPTTFVNGRRISGAQGDLVKQLIAEQLVSARALVKSGADPKALYAKTIATGRDKAERDPQVSKSIASTPHENTIFSHGDDLRKCWTNDAPSDARLTLDVTVHADGTAQASVTPPSTAASCLEGLVKTWAFKRTDSDRMVRFVVVRNADDTVTLQK